MEYYKAIDKWNGSNTLSHYKYVKKIKIGPYTRYFYSMQDLKEYYNSLNDYKNRTTEENIRERQREIDNLDDFANGKSLRSKIDRFFNGKRTVDNKRVLVKNAKKNLSAYTNSNWKLKNSLSSAKQTGKFFVDNLFGYKTQKGAVKAYLTSQAKNRHYHKKNVVDRNLSANNVWYKGLTSYQSSKWRKNK